jgi:hypothetical protein
VGRDDLTGQHARWALILQEYEFPIKHRHGVENANADGLSRLPLPSSEDGTGARLDPVWEDTVIPIHQGKRLGTTGSRTMGTRPRARTNHLLNKTCWRSPLTVPRAMRRCQIYTPTPLPATTVVRQNSQGPRQEEQ